MKNIARLLAFTAIVAPCIASAQAYGPDGAQGVNWGVLGTDPTGSAPADAWEPEDPVVEDFTEDDWITTRDALTTDKVGDPDNYYKSVVDGERKLRFACEPSTSLQADPVLGFGTPNFGHMHMGTGLSVWDENTDFDSIRANPSSTCAGGPLLATNYIEPAMLDPLPSGVTAIRRQQVNIFYYVNGLQSQTNKWTWLRAGTKFVLGANPKNFNDTARRAVYAAAGFEYPGSPDSPAGFQGWQCATGPTQGTVVTVTDTAARMKTSSGATQTLFSRWLRGPDGADPWGGTCTGSTSQPAALILNLQAPGCWDRHNLEAPDGRDHFWYPARKPDNSVTDACPTTTSGESYGHVPALAVKTFYETTGFADYGDIYLSSDRMDPALTVTSGCTNDPVTQGDSCSKDPCRQVGPYFCNAATGHADWIYGALRRDFDEAQRECLGIPVRGTPTVEGPAECNTSQISRYRQFKYAGASPDAAMSGGCATINSCTDASPRTPLELYEIKPGTTGDFTIHNEH